MAVGVGVMLTRPDGRVLVGLRTKPNEKKSWGFPGGRMEAGETFEEAAAREVLEETGIELHEFDTDYIVLVNTQAADVNLTIGLVAQVPMSASAENREPDRFSEWRWEPPARLPAPLYQPTQAVLAAVQHERLPLGWIAYSGGIYSR